MGITATINDTHFQRGLQEGREPAHPLLQLPRHNHEGQGVAEAGEGLAP